MTTEMLSPQFEDAQVHREKYIRELDQRTDKTDSLKPTLIRYIRLDLRCTHKISHLIHWFITHLHHQLWIIKSLYIRNRGRYCSSSKKNVG